MKKTKTSIRGVYYETLIVFSVKSELELNAVKVTKWLSDRLNTEIGVYNKNEVLFNKKEFVIYAPSFCVPDEIVVILGELEEEIKGAIQQDKLLSMLSK